LEVKDAEYCKEPLDRFSRSGIKGAIIELL